MKKFAFTLAEIMIVLSVIAVLTAILLPAAQNATPNEDVMKFKKGHLAFINVINELLNSDKYYLNGDLGVRPNNTLLDGKHEGDNTYFCETFADVLGNIKEKNCQDVKGTKYGVQIRNYLKYPERLPENQGYLDYYCKKNQQQGLLPDITLTDGIMYYQTDPKVPYGINFEAFQTLEGNTTLQCVNDGNCSARLLGDAGRDDNGFQTTYKMHCMDIDGFNQGEDPFGYGVRHDGKIIYGLRASEWFKKSIQEK